MDCEDDGDVTFLLLSRGLLRYTSPGVRPVTPTPLVLHCHMHTCTCILAQVTPTSLVLHYYSQRAGLQWKWVEGVIDVVAKQTFGVQVHTERLLRGRDTGDCDHEVGG